MLTPIERNIFWANLKTITSEKEALLEVEEGIDGWREKESNFKDELNAIKEIK